MKKISYLTLLCFLFSYYNYAQDAYLMHYETAFNVEDESPKATPSNQIKVNLATLFWSTGSINYERQISNRWTVGLTANYRPKGSPSFKSTIQEIFGSKKLSYKDYAFDVDQLEYGNWSISPEVKVYLGKSGAFKGFYVAAFAKYENIDLEYELPLEFDVQGYNIKTIVPLDGSLKPWSGGIYVGYQWKLSQKLYLDWQIIGGNFGGGTLEVSVQQALSEYDQEKIRDFAEEIQDQLSDIEYEVNGQGARIWGNIPWGGLRTGISIGFVF